jgi:hypothetical protein
MTGEVRWSIARWVVYGVAIIGIPLTGLARQPPQVPAAPQQLAAAVNGTAVTLAWQASPSALPLSGYVVEAAVVPSGPAVAKLSTGPTAGLTVNAPNGVYFVRVRALSAAGEGPASAEVTVVVGGPGSCQPPGAPRTLTAGVTGNVVNFSWLPPLTGSVERYELRAGLRSGARDAATVGAGAALALTASAPSGTFYVTVVAVGACGVSAESNEIVVNVGISAAPTCPRADVCVVDGALVLSYVSYAEVFPNGLPTAPASWQWEKILVDLDGVVDVGAYDFVVLLTKSALPGPGVRWHSGAPLRSQGARNNGMDSRFLARRHSVRDFGSRLKAMPFFDTIGRAPSTATIFHEIGHFWPVAPSYRIIDRTTWNAATDPVTWLATSCDAQGHWCSVPWYGASSGGPPLPDLPGLMGGASAKFNPFDLHVMGLIGHAETAALAYFIEAPIGPLRSAPTRHPITQDLIIDARRRRPDASFYVEGDGRRIPDTDPEMTNIRVLVLAIKQDNEALSPAERAILGSTVLRLPGDWDLATWGRSRLTTPMLLR